jgi:PKD repeat protein
MDFRMGSCDNYVIENLVVNNPTGIYFEEASVQSNILYRNNMMNNTNQVTLYGGLNYWDNGAEGNFWDDYVGSDLNGDGVGDSPYFGVDMLPLMEFWSQERIYGTGLGEIFVLCNYTVASFEFNESSKKISFFITGPVGWEGFCNVTVPTSVLEPSNSSEGWWVKVGSNPIFYQRESSLNSTILFFEYVLSSSLLENLVQIMIVEGVFPTANFSFTPEMPFVTETVIFEDLSIPGNESIVWSYWNFGDGSTCNTTEQILNHSYADSGNFTATLTIVDSLGFVDSISKIITVVQHPVADFSYFPSTPLVDEEVTFNASTSFDPDGTITKYIWNFSDGPLIDEGEIVTHSFSDAESYNITLTVSDNHDLIDIEVKTVTISLRDNYATIIVSLLVAIALFCLLILWIIKKS